MYHGRFLDSGEAQKQFTAFWKQYGGTSLPLAVCYTLQELSDFSSAADQIMAANGVPTDQRGVAFMLGIHLDQTSSHAKNRPTIMMVATQFVDNIDRNAGQVDSINNPIIKAGWPPTTTPPGDINDVAYDAGGLWP